MAGIDRAGGIETLYRDEPGSNKFCASMPKLATISVTASEAVRIYDSSSARTARAKLWLDKRDYDRAIDDSRTPPQACAAGPRGAIGRVVSAMIIEFRPDFPLATIVAPSATPPFQGESPRP